MLFKIFIHILEWSLLLSRSRQPSYRMSHMGILICLGCSPNFGENLFDIQTYLEMVTSSVQVKATLVNHVSHMGIWIFGVFGENLVDIYTYLKMVTSSVQVKATLVSRESHGNFDFWGVWGEFI